MEKNLWLLVVLFVPILITGCDKNAELNETVAGYYMLSAEFVYPSNAGSNYYILFNNDTIKGNCLVTRSNPSGTLKVIEKGKTEPAYAEELVLTDNTIVQFLKLGDEIDTYSEDKYTQFSIDIKWATVNDNAKYKATYNGLELNTGQYNKNYVSKDQLTGTLQLEKIDDGSVVLDKEVTIEPYATLTFLQLSTTEFLEMPPGEEEDPESDDYKKVRVYYTLTDELTEESYTIKFYAFDSWVFDMEQTVPLDYEFEIKAGVISQYILVYGRMFENTSEYPGPTILTYDLIAKDGTVVREHDPNVVSIYFDDTNWDGDYLKYLNKFETYNINYASGSLLALEEKW